MADLQRETTTRSPARRPSSLEPVATEIDKLPARCCLGCRTAYEPVSIRGHTSDCPRCTGRPGPTPTAAVACVVAHGQRGADAVTALSEAGVNMHKYRDATLATFDAREDPEALAAARRYLAVWRETHGEGFAYRPWMYLFGDGSRLVQGQREPTIGKTGNGKTHLAIAIARELVAGGLLSPDRVLFAELEEILMRSEATIRGSDDSEDRLVRHYSAPDLLIIDDAFVRPPTNHSMRLLLRILNKRAGRGLILTSNISPSTAKDWEGGMRRIVDRLLDDCGEGGEFLVKFRGRSRRSDRILARAA